MSPQWRRVGGVLLVVLAAAVSEQRSSAQPPSREFNRLPESLQREILGETAWAPHTWAKLCSYLWECEESTRLQKHVDVEGGSQALAGLCSMYTRLKSKMGCPAP